MLDLTSQNLQEVPFWGQRRYPGEEHERLKLSPQALLDLFVVVRRFKIQHIP